ncbi:MAG: ADYC domain-containing protein [Byssovorax sp.]
MRPLNRSITPLLRAACSGAPAALLFALATLAPGCGEATPAPASSADGASSTEQAAWDACLGPPPRGSRIWHENGPDIVGTHVTGSADRWAVVRTFLLDGMVSADGTSIHHVRIEKGALIGALGESTEATEVRGEKWDKAKLKAVLTCADGSTRQLDAQIDKAYRDPQKPAEEAWLYKLSFLHAPVAAAPACEPDGPNGEAGAMAFTGVYNARGEQEQKPGAFSFSCAEAAVAKCARLGYAPWATPDAGKPDLGRDLHAACTRLVRADYCGNGDAATEKGTPVNLWDGAKVLPRGPSKADAPFEAAWSSGGAVCMHHPRWKKRAHECSGRAAPAGGAKLNEFNLPICKTEAEAEAIAGPGKALLFNESSPHE